MSGKLAPLFKTLTHGVYVIGVAGDGRHNAFTAAWVMQVSFDPLMIGLSINRMHSSYALLKAGGGFTVNVLCRGQDELARHFGQPACVDKLAQVPWHESGRGAPLLDDAMAWFECEFVRECPAGDHLVVIGRVSDGALLDAEAEPMNYRDTGDMDGSAALFVDAFDNP
jgi:flavin reductase (DIM6/NTAB) family NADH-FMN oxidoreductase RutF